jgi:hypothetical protein
MNNLEALTKILFGDGAGKKAAEFFDITPCYFYLITGAKRNPSKKLKRKMERFYMESFDYLMSPIGRKAVNE